MSDTPPTGSAAGPDKPTGRKPEATLAKPGPETVHAEPLISAGPHTVTPVTTDERFAPAVERAEASAARRHETNKAWEALKADDAATPTKEN